MKLNVKFIIAVIAFIISAAISSQAQTSATEQPAATTHQRSFGGDPVRQLNLTPEQREQIRTIREENREERAAINQRVRETNRALEEALDSDATDQTVIDQRLQEVAAAQAAAMRMRIMTEVKIRQVLSTEQRVMLREMRRHVYERRRAGTADRQRRLEERTRRVEQRRNRVRTRRGEGQSQQPQE